MRDRSTRRDDLAQLKKEYRYADKDSRRRIKKAAHDITNESRRIRSMRQELIKAHRKGDKKKISEIHYVVEKDSSYRND